MTKNLKIWQFFIFSFFLLVPLVYTSAVADPALPPRLLALQGFLLFFVIYLFFDKKKRSSIDWNQVFRHPVIIVYGLYLFITAISCFFALNYSEAVFDWFKQFGFFVFLLLFVIYIPPNKDAIQLLVKIIGIYTFLIVARGVYELFTLSTLSEFNHQTSYFIRALSANRNLYAQTLFLVLPFNVFGLFHLKRFWKILAAINSVAGLILIIILLTRSVWMATALSIFISGVLLIVFSKSFQLNRRFIRTGLGVMTILILLTSSSIFIYSYFGNTEVFEKQTYWISNYKFGSSLERVDLWEKTLEMAKDHPLIGVGPGNWRIIAPEYGVLNIRDDSGDTFFQRPHNDFLWVFSESGIFGMILYLLIFVFAIFYLARIIRKNDSPKNKYLALLIISGISGYIIIANLSFPKERIEHQVLLHAYLALAILLNLNSEIKNKHQSKFGFWLGLSLLFILQNIGTGFAFIRFRSEILIKQAYESRLNKDWNHVIDRIDAASDPVTTLDVYSTPVEWYKGEALFLLNKTDLALDAFQKAYEANPNHVHVLNNLATCYELLRQRAKAKHYYHRSLNVYPGFKESLLNLCAIYYNENLLDSAYSMLQLADDTLVSERQNSFLKAVLWKSTDNLRQSVDDRIIAKSLERIRNDESWMMKVHKQACESDETFNVALFKEVIFLLESVDSTISSEEEQKFRIKYLNDIKE